METGLTLLGLAAVGFVALHFIAFFWLLSEKARIDKEDENNE